MVRQRIQLRFKKQGNLCFIGHRDLLRTMERLFRRAQLPIALTEGFHPKPRVSYFSALPLGFSSEDEIMEILFSEEQKPGELLERLNRVSVEGLSFFHATVLPPDSAKDQAASFSYEMAISPSLFETIQARIDAFLAASSVMVTKSNGKNVDARPAVLSLTIEPGRGVPEDVSNESSGSLEPSIASDLSLSNSSFFSKDSSLLLKMELAVQSGPEAGVREVLSCLELDRELFRSIFPVRKKTYLLKNLSKKEK